MTMWKSGISESRIKKGMIVSCQKGKKRITTFEGEIFWLQKMDYDFHAYNNFGRKYGVKNINNFTCYCKEFASDGECKHSKEDVIWINHGHILEIIGLAEWKQNLESANKIAASNLPKKGCFVWLKNDDQKQGVVFWSGNGKFGPSIGFKQSGSKKIIWAKIGEFEVASSELKNVPLIKGRNPYRNPFTGEYCTEQDFYDLIKDHEMKVLYEGL